MSEPGQPNFDVEAAVKERFARMTSVRGEQALKALGLYGNPRDINPNVFLETLVDHLVDLQHAAKLLRMQIDLRAAANTAATIYEAERV